LQILLVRQQKGADTVHDEKEREQRENNRGHIEDRL
jgi:hypothetical protein